MWRPAQLLSLLFLLYLKSMHRPLNMFFFAMESINTDTVKNNAHNTLPFFIAEN